MADKSYVSVKCDAKDLFDSTLKTDLVKAMTMKITEMINTKSGGKLTTKDKSTEGFILTAMLAPLKADDKDKPTKLDAKITFTVMSIGSTAKAFTASNSATLPGVGPKVEEAAEDLVTEMLDKFMLKVIKAILDL